MPPSQWPDRRLAGDSDKPSDAMAGLVVEPEALPEPAAPASGSPERHRVQWLDGIRGASAMFVVLHHMWLSVWPEFPRNAGPWWVGWMLYGHLAVAVFIIVSGFSLTLAPMRRSGKLAGGTGRFLRRRAWRILPPYWMALIFSTIITAGLLQTNLGAATIIRGFVVHGLLIQDAVGSFTPNGAFWSIAVEWQIYFVFPLILWFGLKTSIRTAVLCTVALVLVAHVVGSAGSPLNKIDHLTPQFLALFAMGVLAAYAGRAARDGNLRRPLSIAGVAALGGLALVALVKGSVWVVDRYFWVDLIFGGGVACLIAVMYSGGGARARGLLSSPVAMRLGLFSYSIYLLHGPLVGVLDQDLLRPMHLAPLVTFVLLLGVGTPVILALCYGFHLMFEAPFLTHRDLSALRSLPIVDKLASRRRVRVSPAGVVPPEVVTARESTL
jgi:peptidoglycan/LPS O-acetylase OafA/YrhL